MNPQELSITLSTLLTGKLPEENKQGSSGVDRVLSVFNQVTLVALLIFMLAAILFRVDTDAKKKEANDKAQEAIAEADKAKEREKKAKGEADAAKEQVKVAEKDAQDAEDRAKQAKEAAAAAMTRAGAAEAAKDKAEGDLEKQKSQISELHKGKVALLLINLHQQKLLEALNQLEQEERTALALDYFCDAQHRANVEIMKLVFRNGRISEDSASILFSKGCHLAQEHYIDTARREGLAAKWFSSSLKKTNLEVDPSGQKIVDPKTGVSAVGVPWLNDEISRRLGKIATDVRGLQENARTILFVYYQSNPGEIKDKQLHDLLDEYGEIILKEREKPSALSHTAAKNNASFVKTQHMLLTQISVALSDYVYLIFEQGNAPLLR